jgi:hypothetical protein
MYQLYGSTQKGQVALLMTFIIIPMAGMLGLVTDLGL